MLGVLHSRVTETFSQGGRNTLSSTVRTGNRPSSLAMVLAGGRGSRLRPLTRHRSKPVIPFGPDLKIIDFTLSNLVNSGISDIVIMSHYDNEHEIKRHIIDNWLSSQSMMEHSYFWRGTNFIVCPGNSRGTADAVSLNLKFIHQANPDIVLIFSSDQTYSMDVRQMVQFHYQHGAEITIATMPVAIEESYRFGTCSLEHAGSDRITEFEEKSSAPNPMPNNDKLALASIGNYIFNTDVLLHEIGSGESNETDNLDLARDILSSIVPKRRTFSYNILENRLPDQPSPSYWRDVGTIESYFQASMELLKKPSGLDLRNPSWPIGSTKLENNSVQENSLVHISSPIFDRDIRNSIIGPSVNIAEDVVIEDSIVLGYNTIGRGTKIYKAIIDEGVSVAPYDSIGLDNEYDSSRFYCDPSGVTVVTT